MLAPPRPGCPPRVLSALTGPPRLLGSLRGPAPRGRRCTSRLLDRSCETRQRPPQPRRRKLLVRKSRGSRPIPEPVVPLRFAWSTHTCARAPASSGPDARTRPHAWWPRRTLPVGWAADRHLAAHRPRHRPSLPVSPRYLGLLRAREKANTNGHAWGSLKEYSHQKHSLSHARSAHQRPAGALAAAVPSSAGR